MEPPPPPQSDTTTSYESETHHAEDQEIIEENTGSTSKIMNDEPTPNEDEESTEMPMDLLETEMIRLLYKEIQKMATKITYPKTHITKATRASHKPLERNILGIIKDPRKNGQVNTKLASNLKDLSGHIGMQGKGAMAAQMMNTKRQQ
jgi:hypothetical protein